MSRKKAISTIYFKNVLVREISIPINKIGSNLKNILKNTLANKLEGRCSKEGYIKSGSIEILTYSTGILEGGFVNFNVSFECLVCNPVEGMIIKCKVNNVTKAGIRASYYNNIESPITVFIARDHYFNQSTFVKIKEDDIISTKVIGIRYELNDTNIYIISELVKIAKQKQQKTQKNTKK